MLNTRYGALLLTTASWGSTFFLIKDLLERMPTLDFLAVRFSIAGVVTLVVMHRAVFALNRDVVMLNDQARATLTPGDQSTLLAQAMEAKLTRRGTVLVELPSGQGARMHCRRVGGGREVEADRGAAP